MVSIPFPDGGLGVVAKVALGVVGALWWTSGPGADEARYACDLSMLGHNCSIGVSIALCAVHVQ
jgi:hypothetical protein